MNFDNSRILARFIYESKKEKDKFFGVTKIIDTGSPKSFYLGPNTWNFMKNDGVLKVIEEDGPVGVGLIKYNGLKF